MCDRTGNAGTTGTVIDLSTVRISPLQLLAYQSAGGFCDVVRDEDVGLVAAFARAGEKIVWATDLPVTTSSRRVGRAPAGFAAYLDRLAVGVDAAVAPLGAF